MSSFGGREVDHVDTEAQLKSLTEIQRMVLQGIDPSTLNLVVSEGGDFVIDDDGNILRWE